MQTFWSLGSCRRFNGMDISFDHAARHLWDHHRIDYFCSVPNSARRSSNCIGYILPEPYPKWHYLACGINADSSKVMIKWTYSWKQLKTIPHLDYLQVHILHITSNICLWGNERHPPTRLGNDLHASLERLPCDHSLDSGHLWNLQENCHELIYYILRITINHSAQKKVLLLDMSETSGLFPFLF